MTEQHTSSWDPVECADGDCLHWQIGPFRFWIERKNDEWHTAIERVAQEDVLVVAQPGSKPEKIAWTRWAAVDDSRTIALRPMSPDRAVLVRPDSPFLFPPGSDLKFFVSIPIWIRVLTGKEQSSELFTEPAVILSNSWFGTPTDGDLCYSLRTTARRTTQSIRKRPHMAVCPIHIRNEAPASLEFQRLCIRAPHLELYQDTERLWTSPVNVTYHGEDQMGRTQYGDKPPAASAEARLISQAREPVTKSRIQRSFDDLKSFIRM